MEFFDQQSEVIDFTLTPYGISKLKEGVLDFKYFILRDTDVMYFNTKGGLSEEINEDERIRFQTPMIKLNPRSISVGDSSRKLEGEEYLKIEGLLKDLIGNISNFTSKDSYPLWDLVVLNGEIDDTKSSEQSIEFEEFLFKFKRDLDKNRSKEGEEWGYIFLDNTSIKLEEDYLFLQVEELNTDNSLDKFEIELYEIIDEDNEDFKELYFNVNNKIKGNKLVLQENEEYVINESMAEQYLDILVDYEIPDEYFCRHKDDLYKNNDNQVFINDIGISNIETRFANCDKQKRVKIYTTRKEDNLGNLCEE